MEKINKIQLKVYLDNLSDAIINNNRDKAVSILALIRTRFEINEVLY